jgi:predicted acyltransferase
LHSLDAFRGFTMFWIVGGKSLLMALSKLDNNAVSGAIGYQLNHSLWEGLRFYDVIWPAFMLMVGVSIPFSYARRRQTYTDSQIRWQALRRAAVLFLLGSLRTSISGGKPELVELSSALQPIALAYLTASFLAGASWKMQSAVGGLLLAAYGFLLAPFGYAIDDNLVRTVDLMVLGRTHAEGWGTVLSALPTISTTLLGLLLGELLMSQRTARAKLKIIALAGLGGVALGLLLSPVIPVVMKLWTTSYGLLSAGAACLQFLVFYWVIDVLGYRKWAFPFVVIGMNAITIYLGVTLVNFSRISGVFSRPVAAQLGAWGPVFNVAAVVLLEWLVLFWMYRRKVFLRA